jgi:hypothetical protein
MIYMAEAVAHRLGTCAVALGTGVAGIVAQVTAPPESPSIGQIGVGTSIIGATYLIIAVIREGSPPLQRLVETLATARNDRIRLEARLELLGQQHAEDAAKIAELERKLDETDTRARRAENDLENAKVAADARHEAIERRAREATHMARNNAQRLQNIELSQGSGSGTIDVLPPPGPEGPS